MSQLTSREIDILFKALQQVYGFGYSKDLEVGRLQAKLSVMAQVRVASGDKSHEQPPKKS